MQVEISYAVDKQIRDYQIERAPSTLTTGEDNPLPGGEAKGDGNGCPVTPLVKCGMAFTETRHRRSERDTRTTAYFPPL